MLRLFRSLVPALLCSPLLLAAESGTSGADLSKSKGDTANSETPDLKGWVRRSDPAMEKWRDNRFGCFIHFGIYSILGGQWNDKEVPGAAEWIKVGGKIPSAEYDKLVKQFTLENFDAKRWAADIKKMGAKYVIITTKHHDGFCLWDSKLTDYDIGSSPTKHAVLKELADAVRAEGMDMYFYYSIIDWHNPDYRAADPKTPEDQAAYARYLEFMKGQLKELLTDFGDIKGLWFDGRWDASYKNHPDIGKSLEAWLRELKPGIVLGDRVRAYDSFADYNSGYERKLPKTQPLLDWEACMTIPENSWGYHKTWSGAGRKTPKTLVEMLVRSAAMSGNFVLNIGPKGDGTFAEKDVERMKPIGEWMKRNGASIYGTEGLALTLPAGNYATRKDDRVFIHSFQWPENDKLALKGLPGPIKSCTLMTPEGEKTIRFQGETLIDLPLTAPDAIDSVFTVTVGTK
ncbi:alpha-L-fucosidase [Luteolibacter sp. LG18]|uniref:alpha-L-fucosidase n=1 Tax=Luteolibacter sp. LG18 TaxID=2819286 RepID=UPI002B2FB779|nr:alpha-L-fucosidase [Luteolibacter sp. LG18]